MILKSFFRKKTTKIYFFIFVIIFIGFQFLGIFNTKLKMIKESIFKESSLLVAVGDENMKKMLESCNHITDTEEILIIDKEKISIPNVDEIYNDDLGGIIVYSNKNRNIDLIDNEVILSLNKNSYIRLKKNNKYNNDTSILILSEERNSEFKIKDMILSENYSSLIVSEKVFEELLKKNNKIMYSVIADSEDNILSVMGYIDKKYDTIFLEDYTEENIKYLGYIDNIYTGLRDIRIYFSIIFFIVIIITSKNMSSDLKDNINLEYKLGFSEFEIKKNIFSRMINLHTLSLGTVILISAIIMAILYKNGYVKSYLIDINLNICIYISLLLCDLLLSIIVNNKSKCCKRR